jgi:tRNA dimethylallyltransferase
MSSINHKPILILMGPTASGKSAMGLSIAKRIGGAILNADAMQCYADLRIITARPSQAEMGDVPHHLYGIWDARTMGNAALWQAAAIAKIHEVWDAGQGPILLGGTGMYIKSLTDGLSAVPPISDEVKAQVAALSSLYEALQRHDPAMAARLEPNDQQRIARALEVMLQTGRSLDDWQAEAMPAPFSAKQCHFAQVDIPREVLYDRINQRFTAMIESGALDEISALKAQFSAAEIQQQRFPILKSLGVPELMAHLNGEITLDAAIAKAQQLTRNYAKRQLTWARGQVKHAAMLPWDGGEEAVEGWLKQISLPFTPHSA